MCRKEGTVRVLVTQPAWDSRWGRNRVWVDKKDAEHQHLVVVGFANQVQFPKT